MNLVKQAQVDYMKKNIPELRSGDVVKVHQKIQEGKKTRIQIFEGVVIKTSGGKTLDATFTVRRKSFGIGVEITFPLHSPAIVKIEKTKRIKVRRSKLYYLRNLTDKQIRRRGELKEVGVWEEKDAEEEEAKLKAAKEAEAKKKQAEEESKQAELDKKFSQAQKAHGADDKAEEPKVEAESK